MGSVDVFDGLSDKNDKARLALELIRRKAEKSHFYFVKEVLGYTAVEEQPHLLMCSSVQHGGRKQLHLWPRGHFKSTTITIGFTIWKILQNPNIRILIANATLQNAKAFLREIKGHLEKNELLNMLYGSFVSKEDKWTETEIIVSRRTANLKEPTVLVAGVGQSLTGLHFDLIIGDDLVNYDTVNTAEQIEKTKRWWGDAISLLEPDGQIIAIGTRYHYADLYGHIIENLSEEYEPQVHSAYLEDGSPLFPTKFSLETLAEIKKEQGSFQFACQYLNNPIDDETAKFRKSWIKYEPVLPEKQYYTTMTVDRAYSLSKLADYTGISIKKQDMDGFWHIVYARRHKLTENELIRRIFDLREHYAVDKVGIEQMAYEQTLKPYMDEEMRRLGVFFPVVELKNNKQSKIARIEGLVPRFETGSVYFTGDEVDFADLVDEMLRFPLAEHDDILDSLSYHNNEEMVGGVGSGEYVVFSREGTTGYGGRPVVIRGQDF